METDSQLSLRSKLFQTFWLFWAFNHRGIHNVILGPTLLDLQLLLNVDLSALSYLFLSSGFGSMLGSVFAGIFSKKYDIRLQLWISLILGAITMALTPAVSHLIYMYVMVLLFGISRGSVVCYVMLLATRLWEKKGSPFQFITSGTSVGAIIAPIIIQPFLCSGNRLRNTTMFNEDIIFSGNYTSASANLTETGHMVNCGAEDTYVQWAYAACGLYMLPSGLAHAYYWWQDRNGQTYTPSEYTSIQKADEKKTPVTFFFLIALSAMYVFLSALPASFSAYLTVYGVNGPLSMLKYDMITMTVIFWVGSLIGRLFTAVYSKFFSNFAIIIAHLIGLVISGILFVVLVSDYSVVLWLSSFAIGYFSAPYLGGIMAWLADMMELNPTMTSICFISSGMGNMIFPFTTGILMDVYDVGAYVYFIMVLIICMCMSYLALASVGEFIKRQRKNKADLLKLFSK